MKFLLLLAAALALASCETASTPAPTKTGGCAGGT